MNNKPKFCDACGLKYPAQTVMDIPVTVMNVTVQLCETCRNDLAEFFTAKVAKE